MTRRHERGSITAEFAVTLPAVLLVLVSCLAGVQLASASLQLQGAAAGAARSLARGETVATAAAHVTAVLPGAQLSAFDRGEFACVQATRRAAGPFSLVTLSAKSCALAGGR